MEFSVVEADAGSGVSKNDAGGGSGGAEVWADYAKDRFDFFAERVNELRDRARQLAAAVGVVLGIELTFVGRVLLDAKPLRDGRWLFLCAVVILFAAFACQLLVLGKLSGLGYGSKKIPGGPESPSNEKLKTDLLAKSERDAKQTLGLYYADTEIVLSARAEAMSLEMDRHWKKFIGSLWLLFFGCLALVLCVTLLRMPYDSEDDGRKESASPRAVTPRASSDTIRPTNP